MTTWHIDPPPEEYYRILSPDGSLTGEQPELDDDTLIEMYRVLVQTRRYERKVNRMQRRGEISVAADSVGEEAVGIGTAAALEAGDWYYPSYRQTSGLFHLGVRMDRILAKLMGTEPETRDDTLTVSDASSPNVTVTPGSTPLAVNVGNAVGTAMADAFVAEETGDDPEAVTMVYIGEGATSEGDFHEALNFAGVFDAPVVVVCQNNQWAISVPAHRQTSAETFAQKADAHGVPHTRVDGNDVFAVYDAAKTAVDRARTGGGPTLVEAVTYRRTDHNTADDQSVYRDETASEYWEERDPVDRFEAYLRERGLLDDETVERLTRSIDERIEEAVAAARSVPESDPLEMFEHHLHDEGWSHRRQRWELATELDSENPFDDHDGEQTLGTKRSDTGGGTAHSESTGSTPTTRDRSLIEAIREGLAGEMERDDTVRLLGYDIGPIGGVFRTTEGLYDRFGDTRVIDTPLSENALVGTAVGMAMRGERPVVEIQFMGFLYPAFGQLQYTLAKMHERTAGGFDVPVTLRIPYGGGIEASEFHSESTEAYLVHTPGIRVVVPSTPADAKGLLAASIRCDDPVVFLEPKRLYREARGQVPRDTTPVPLDEARTVRSGDDVTLIAWGAMVREATAAAQSVAADVEVLDLRSLSPLDVDAILTSVRKTGRCVILHEARRTAGLGAEIAALVGEYATDRLKAPVKRATGFDVHFPGHQVEDAYLPDATRARNAIQAVMDYEY
jgi:2-oxoisovalerate dehydrogenase E1 component